jgi:hypothetical protein
MRLLLVIFSAVMMLPLILGQQYSVKHQQVLWFYYHQKAQLGAIHFATVHHHFLFTK